MFNRGGIDALITKPRTGRPCRIALETLGDLLVPVLGDPASDGERHWAGVEPHGWLRSRITGEISCRGVIRVMHALDFHRRNHRSAGGPPLQCALRSLMDDPVKAASNAAFRK
ncbi:MAG: hypothetical protein EOP86_06255 [Verrucomicrobiaceae bacterium]|nr:MAG: hypothetical protein EOP86_06255 [Verrucomicrobiaceae bacterium]